MRLLVVCDGNTCRSPMAAALAARAAARRGLALTVRSAGLAAVAGAPASPPAVAAMARRGLDLTGHRAARLTGDHLAEADAVWVMTAAQAAAVAAIASAPVPVVRLTEAAGGTGDIADPFGGAAADYEALAEGLGVLVDGALDRKAI